MCNKQKRHWRRSSSQMLLHKFKSCESTFDFERTQQNQHATTEDSNFVCFIIRLLQPFAKHRVPEGLMLQTGKPMAPQHLKMPDLFVNSWEIWHPFQSIGVPRISWDIQANILTPRQLKTSLLLVSSWDFWHPLNKQGTKDLMSRNRQIPVNMETVKTALYVCTLHEMFDTQYNIFMSVLHLVKTM